MTLLFEWNVGSQLSIWSYSLIRYVDPRFWFGKCLKRIIGFLIMIHCEFTCQNLSLLICL